MRFDFLGQIARRACPWVCLAICLGMILGGCGKKETPLSKAAQTCKKTLLAEMNMLTTSLAGPVAKQDWGTVETILQTSFEKLQKESMFAPVRLGVLDRDGIIQGMYPPKKDGSMDFSNYQPARIVYEQKRKTTAMLYLEGNKIFIFISPILQQDQVTGAVVMVFPDEGLQKWKVSEKEFLSIDFNQ
jgi:hypothetical protein